MAERSSIGRDWRILLMHIHAVLAWLYAGGLLSSSSASSTVVFFELVALGFLVFLVAGVGARSCSVSSASSSLISLSLPFPFLVSFWHHICYMGQAAAI